jgi:hypothetical protein
MLRAGWSLVAVHGDSVADALGAVTGIESRTVIDAANLAGATLPDGFAPSSGYVKARVAGARRADVSEPVDRAGLKGA